MSLGLGLGVKSFMPLAVLSFCFGLALEVVSSQCLAVMPVTC